MDVLEKTLEKKMFLVGNELTIADIAWLPWVVCLDVFYASKDILEIE